MASETFGGCSRFESLMAKASDYYIVTRETGEGHHPWSWELRRRGQPMGVKVIQGGYHSQMAAEFAGKRALTEFLDALLREERRR
jgi:hypothetical protein